MVIENCLILVPLADRVNADDNVMLVIIALIALADTVAFVVNAAEELAILLAAIEHVNWLDGVETRPCLSLTAADSVNADANALD
jgi:hypothetical protein